MIGEPKERNRLEVHGDKGSNIEGIGCGRVYHMGGWPASCCECGNGMSGFIRYRGL